MKPPYNNKISMYVKENYESGLRISIGKYFKLFTQDTC